MTTISVPYIPGIPPPKNIPLARFLPPIPVGAVSTWLQSHCTRESADKKKLLIVDPFGSDPHLPIEIAAAGYCVLVTVNNPIIRFVLETCANLPDINELRAALSELATTRKGDERLEPYIRSLYSTTCDNCGASVIAEAYLWERGSEHNPPTPYAKIYHCTNCSNKGEFPLNAQDITLIERFSSSGLQRTRALERVASLDDPDREHVDDALKTYLPRSLYALFTILNKRDSLKISPKRLNLINAFLVSAFDQVNGLWTHPISRTRPRQLSISPKFREYNVWLALEESISQWINMAAQINTNINVCHWPELPPPQGGISLYEGRFRDLIEHLPDQKIGAIITAFPRPNQAFWSLSAIWAGWLWGRDAVQPIKSVLHRRRYDWGWHTMALSSTLSSLSPKLDIEVPFFGLIGENEPGFLTSALVAADLAGFELSGIALRQETGQAQLNWLHYPKAKPNISLTQEIITQPSKLPNDLDENYQNELIREVIDYLCVRAEPATYPYIHAAAISSLVTAPHLKISADLKGYSYPSSLSGYGIHPSEIPGHVNSLLENSLTTQAGFSRFGGSEKSLEVGQWWINDIELNKHDIGFPLDDRVETAIIKYLCENPGLNILHVDQMLCQLFPGLHTPSPELIQICLESYGSQSLPESGHWFLREQDDPKLRQAELANLKVLLVKIAHRLGYITEGDSPMLWRDITSRVVYAWYITPSAIFDKILLDTHFPPQISLILFPGSRSNLVIYKLHHNARLNHAFEMGWRLVKFRQLREISESANLYSESFDQLIALDELTYNAPQMRLF